ncbi:hypothetical protein [Desulfobacula phenolica]|uniref:Uncharacterized protein n=1 Tax=Desulfobacula phenolica TaxID=90732 RepID=A0A1H2I3Q3_9BACT|nr:hypothetical protein [Desulfobacula phenolica]SDU38428.1 hypothetical protein SAMN04487931_107201 [Desulfobacula phenolica]
MATLTELQEELAQLKATAKSVRDGGQGYGQGNRSLNRVDYGTLQKEIRDLERRIEMAKNNGRLPGFHPVFGGNRG